MEGITSLSLEEKRKKISTNYETIQVLKNRLNDFERSQKIGMTRAAYIKMILDVTKKVEAQSKELSKLIVENRSLQRANTNLVGRLDRSFKLVEETVLKNARNDSWSRECYRLLNSMHEYCDQLIKAVQETGELAREIRQLEDQISQIKASRTIVN